jgi:hypothetical protein
MPQKKPGGFLRDYFREFNRVMTRGHMVIDTRQQPDSPRERIRSQIIIAIFLITFLILCVLQRSGVFVNHADAVSSTIQIVRPLKSTAET